MRIIGGQFRGKQLATPKSDTIRPTSDRLRETLFNILAHGYEDPVRDARVIDLFAGTGALGFEALSRGADDYMSKPFDPRELALRIEAILRRTGGKPLTPREIHMGAAVFDMERLELTRDGALQRLTEAEAQLLKTLAKKNGLILFTDSDAAGFRIRTYITGLVGAENVVQAYVPAIHGKEKRKPQPGKEGLLGVEGVDDAIVLQCLRDADERCNHEREQRI